MSTVLRLWLFSLISPSESDIRSGPHLRLEIHEQFLSVDTCPQRDPFLRRMAEIAPLWLDDFGAGSTGLSWLLSERFEAVKIDRKLIETLYTRSGGTDFLRGICELVTGWT